jgi:hypothetical protein
VIASGLDCPPSNLKNPADTGVIAVVDASAHVVMVLLFAFSFTRNAIKALLLFRLAKIKSYG